MRQLRKRKGGKKQADLVVKGVDSKQMPAVGARRSTRVFVPKSASKVGAVGVGDGDAAAAVVLRSGKRLVVSKPAGKKVEADGCEGEWMRLFGWRREDQTGSGRKGLERGDGVGQEGGGNLKEDGVPMPIVERDGSRKMVSGKKFGIVYCRKRGRASASDDLGEKNDARDRRFGLAFIRRKQRKTIEFDSASLAENTKWMTAGSLGGHQIPYSTRNFAEVVGVRLEDLWDGVELGVLLVLVDVSYSRSMHHFCCFLLSTLCGIGRKRIKLLNLSSFLLSNTIANVFSNHGVHFLPLKWDSYISCRNAASGVVGICGIFGAQMFTPLLCVNFSALPFYFKSLHLSMLLSLRPLALAGYSSWEGKLVDFSAVVAVPECPNSYCYTGESRDTDTGNSMLGKLICDAFNTNPGNQLSRLEDTHVLQDPKLMADHGTAHWMKVRRHKKKRTSLRSSRIRNSSSNTRRNGISSIHKRILKVNSSTKANSLGLSKVVPSFADVTDGFPSDFSSPSEDHDLTSPMSPYHELKMYAHKNVSDTPKDLKSTLSMLKQSIDSVSAKANILIIETDRCWREEGAEVMLEASYSNEWHLAVKVNGLNRYLHRPQEMKLCTTNRITHAMIWTGEDSWKLEFSDRIDWLIFKELHRECCDRNSHSLEVTAKNTSKKMIPVPVVRLVPGNEDLHGTFVQPDIYIKTKHDELERAFTSKSAYYDMDSGDEEWLEQLNSSLPGDESGGLTHVSDNDFEKIIFCLEKAAYSNPDEIFNPEKAIGYCSEFGCKDVIAAVFDYWSEKKRQKRTSSLVRIFREPSRKTMVIQKPFLRKRRSFKRQGTHAGRGKPEFYLQVGAMREESRRVEDARSAATAAMEVARKTRSRAQILMANADLATYKASLALRIAEAIREEAPLDLSSILY